VRAEHAILAASAAVLGGVAYAKRYHAHICPCCDTRWEHSSLFQLTERHVARAHACPGCGTDWRWIDGPLGCPEMERLREEDAARVRRGEPARYEAHHAHAHAHAAHAHVAHAVNAMG